MAEPIDRALLGLVLDCIIPPDEDPGATDLGVDGYVLAELKTDRARQADAIAEGLGLLAAEGFSRLDARARHAAIVAVQNERWFAVLCELAAEGFYADPANGGNRDALSWTMLGYQHRLPNGPSGTGGQ